MPGTVLRVLVAPGDQVAAGQVLMLLEAMKMELTVVAPAAGVVAAVLVAEGELVAGGQQLIEVDS
jgi:biotin carboxyl carrier protein